MDIPLTLASDLPPVLAVAGTTGRQIAGIKMRTKKHWPKSLLSLDMFKH